MMYFDNIIIFARAPMEQLKQLRAVLIKLQKVKVKLKLKSSKCKFI